jgi:hypothetical protein
MRLAFSMGTWNVDAMLAEMPASLMAEWEHFFELEPHGSEIDALRAAQTTWALASIHRQAGKKQPELTDFAIGYRKPRAVEQPLHTLAENLMEAFGVGKSIRPDGQTKGR